MAYAGCRLRTRRAMDSHEKGPYLIEMAQAFVDDAVPAW